MVEYLVNYPISRFGVLPHVIRMLVDTQLPSAVFEKIAQMSVIAIGGAALPKRLEDEFNAKIDAAPAERTVSVQQAWGMTEVGWVFQSLGIAKERESDGEKLIPTRYRVPSVGWCQIWRPKFSLRMGQSLDLRKLASLR